MSPNSIIILVIFLLTVVSSNTSGLPNSESLLPAVASLTASLSLPLFVAEAIRNNESISDFLLSSVGETAASSSSSSLASTSIHLQCSALLLILRHKSIPLLKNFTNTGISFERLKCGIYGDNGLMMAASQPESSSLDSVSEILDLEPGIDVDAESVIGGNTALHYAVLQSKSPASVSKLIIDAHASVSIVNSDGKPPLLMTPSWKSSDPNIIEILSILLILGGADANTVNSEGETMLMTASFYGVESLAVLLLKEVYDKDPTRLNLDMKSTSTHFDNGGNTAIAYACKGMKPNIVRMLLNRGADPNIVNNLGMSPLMIASSGGYEDIVDMLLAHGANTEIRVRGKAALDLALYEPVKLKFIKAIEHDDM